MSNDTAIRFRLPRDLLAAIDATAKDRGQTRSAFIRDALEVSLSTGLRPIVRPIVIETMDDHAAAIADGLDATVRAMVESEFTDAVAEVLRGSETFARRVAHRIASKS